MLETVGLKIPRMLKIDEVAAEFGLTRHFVRQLCLNDKIVYVKAGRKYLINAEKLAEYLNTGDKNFE